MKKFIRFGLYLCAVVFAGLATCEVILERYEIREWERQDAIIRPYYQWCFNTRDGERIGFRRGRLKLMYHPYLVYSNLPNQTDPHFHINSVGARGPEIGPHVSGKTRIILLGGSAAFGTGLNDDSETLAKQLEAMLPNTEVINAAVIGHESRQELTAYVNKWCDLDGDLVIEFGGHNDFSQGSDGSADFGGMNVAIQMQSELTTLHAIAYADFPTRLYNGYRSIFPQVSQRIDTVIARLEKTSSSKINGNALIQSSASTFYAANMEKLDKVVRAYKGRFVCVLQPAKSSGDSGYDVFKREVISRLTAAGVNVVDAGQIATKLRSSMFMDEMHLDPEGNRIVARELAKAFHKRRLI